MPRLLPHFRSTKITVLAVGGALCVATAASAVAATWPSVSGAPSPAAVQQAAAGLAAAPSLANAGNAAAVSASQAAASAAAVEQAAQRKAAAAAATREHAAHVAHEAHVTAVTLEARAAQQAAAQRAAQQEAAQQATPQATQQAAPVAAVQASVPSGSAQQIAQGMLASFGWSSGQFSCLQPLWEAESGWSVSAQNPSSGAYGIPQALPGSKMASAGSDWATNPATQIKWGLEYIQSTYGSPCAAWSHEESDGWY